MSIDPNRTTVHSSQAITHPQQPLPITVKGDIFIAPFRAFWIYKQHRFDRSSMRYYPDLFGPEEERYTLCFQVLATSEESENWEADGVPSLEGRIQDIRFSFPSYLPCSFFFGKREGETIYIHSPHNNINFELTCRQKEHRHREKPFENLVEEMFMVAYNSLSNKTNRSNDEEEHLVSLEGIKQQYYPASEITHRGMEDQCVVC